MVSGLTEVARAVEMQGCFGRAERPAAKRCAGGGSGRSATSATHAGADAFVPDGTLGNEGRSPSDESPGNLLSPSGL